MPDLVRQACGAKDPRPSILIVDDDPGIRRDLAAYLTEHEYDVRAVASGAEMDRAMSDAGPDVVLLDVMMPGEDGLQICRRISADRNLSVMILSAMGAEIDRIVGLELGADDYMAKPFNPRELLAHLRAVLRRRAGGQIDEDAGRDYGFRRWRLSVLRNQLFTPSGVLVQLSASEFRMLSAFVRRPMRILDRDHLLGMIRGADHESYDRIIDVTVSRLRRKLALGEDGEELIQTVRSQGYVFNTPVVRL